MQLVVTAGSIEAPRVQLNWARVAQDSLRHLLHAIFTRCPTGGEIRASTLAEFELGERTFTSFSRFSRIRDVIETATRGSSTCTFDYQEGLIRIENPPGAALDVARREERLRELKDRPSVLTDRDREELREAAELVRRTVELDPELRSFSYRSPPETISAFAAFDEKFQVEALPTERLPPEWSLGPYTLADYRTFWTHLRVMSHIHCQLLADVRIDGLVPFNAGVPVLASEELLEHLELFGGLDRQTSKEILRDMTYNPNAVKWTDPAYQPIVPLDEKQIALVPALVDGSNYERNLLVLAEKLPWRVQEASRLKNLREDLMIEAIEAAAAASGFRSRPRLVVRSDDGEALGDLDVLLWTTGGDHALALELKWFYGPDSVHETFQHAARYGEAAKTHLDLVEPLREEGIRTLINRYALEGLQPDAKLHPLLVSKDDEPLAGSVPAELPVVPLAEFLDMLRNSASDVGGVSRLAFDYSNRVPDLEVRMVGREVPLGDYSIRFPSPTISNRTKNT